MFSAMLVALVCGQTAPLQKYTLRCQEGHPISINGYLDNGKVHAILGAPVVYRGPHGGGAVAPASSTPSTAATSAASSTATSAVPASAPQGGTGPAANYGVMTGALDHLPPGKEWYGGNAPKTVGAGATGKPINRVHLTFIGTEAEREAARRDLESNPEYQQIAEQLGDLLAVQDYDPSNPLVKNIGLPDGGRPDVIIQTTAHPLPLYRAHEYPGAKILVGEIRKADPRYNPANDPNGSPLGGGFDLSKFLQLPSTLTEWLIVAGVCALLWYLVKD